MWDWPEHATNKGDMTGHAALFEIAKHRGDMKEDLLSKKVAVMAHLIGRVQPSRRSLSIAVLTRRNDVAEGIASQLEQRGVRTALEGATQICDNDLVQVMLSLVKFAEHPGDTFAWEHIRMTPLGALLPPKERAALEILGDIYDHGFAYLVRTWAHLLETRGAQTLNDFCRRRLGELLAASKMFDATGNKSCLDYIDFIRSFTIPASSHSGAVQVLTTHKAKGLEYDVVFLADLDGSQSITRARGGGVKVKKGPDGEPRWALVMPNRAVSEQDATLAGFLGELDRESFLEELCVLYVGMTRAAKALYMLVEQKGPSSKAVRPADIVRDTLITGEVPRGDEKALAALDAVCLYAKGPENWYEKYPAAKEATLAHGTERKLRVSFDEALEATAPSRMEKRTVSLSALLEGRTQEALVLGLAVHSIFERLKDPGSQDVEAIAKEWRECTEFGDEVKAQASEMFLNACASAEVRSALTVTAEHATVWIEKAFDAVVDNQWVSGVFDRVMLVARETGGFRQATIIDYKTDYVGNEKDIEGIVATYRPQLLLYRTVLGRLVDLAEEHIEMKLVLAAPARVVAIEP
jgi:ATP-dependent exoDNAse (exonuclease V) beta subunit